jgi:putative oxygen-independent coproporphyrinogen III oxidase
MPMPTESPLPQPPSPPPFGVYVHFPYCQQKCPYCDFAVAVRKQIPHQRYLRALTCELQAKASLFPNRRAISVYFGGGTPSLWQVDCLAAALRTILAAFPPPAGLVPEVTVECDPHGTTLAQLQALHAAGVNRLSIGAQSLQPRHLITLGRQHTPQEIPQVVEHARAAGFANLSLDLMIGLCGQRRDELAADLEGLLALAPEHVSLYQLTVEPGTPLAASIKRGTQIKPSDDDQADAYEQVRTVLSQSGYQHYEVSSFCKVPHVTRRRLSRPPQPPVLDRWRVLGTRRLGALLSTLGPRPGWRALCQHAQHRRISDHLGARTEDRSRQRAVNAHRRARPAAT